MRSGTEMRDVKVPWSEVVALTVPNLVEGAGVIRGASINLNDIVWELKGGEKYTFYPESQFKRDQVYASLSAIRLRALRETRHAGSQFLPRQLTFLTPLKLVSQLPFQLDASLQQLPPGVFESASPRAWSKVPIPPPPTNARPTAIVLAPYVPQKSHAYHALTPLRLAVWLGVSDYEQATLHGSVDLHRPSTEGREKTFELAIHPPGNRHSALRVRLLVKVRADPCGSCSLSISAANWLCNYSSLPLQLYYATGGTRVASSKAYDPRQRLFSLSPGHDRVCFRLGHKRATLKVDEPTSSKRSGSTTGRASRFIRLARKVKSELSKAFSISKLKESHVTLQCPDHTGADLVVRIVAAQGGTGVVEVRDRYVIRNQTGISLHWRGVSMADKVLGRTSETAEIRTSRPPPRSPRPTRLLPSPQCSPSLPIPRRHLCKNSNGLCTFALKSRCRLPASASIPSEIPLPADGSDVPLRWHYNTSSSFPRAMQLLPTGTEQEYHWCEYFSIDEMG